MVLYNKKEDDIILVTDTFKDEDVDVNFVIFENSIGEGLMDFEYMDDNCIILGWL